MMKTKDVFFYGLQAIVILGFFSVMIIMIMKGSNPDALNLVLGALVGSYLTVVNYQTGSSKGSAEKTELLAKSTPLP